MRRFVTAFFFLACTMAAVFYFRRPKSETSHPFQTQRAEAIPESSPSPSKSSTRSNSTRSGEPTPAEREKVLSQMADEKREHDAWYDRATLFEKELTRVDIARITEGYPNSFFRRVGVFTTQNAFRGKCSRDEYEKLKRTMPLETLHERVLAISKLVQLYDERHLSDYTRKIRVSWTVDFHWKEFRDLDRYYDEVDALHRATIRTDAEYAEKVSAFETELVKSGVPPAGVASYALRTAASHPNCLGPLAVSDLYRWLKRDLTDEREKILQGRLKAYCYSDGPDGNSGTEDDIRIGTFAK